MAIGREYGSHESKRQVKDRMVQCDVVDMCLDGNQSSPSSFHFASTLALMSLDIAISSGH